jgi:hypothetical protein
VSKQFCSFSAAHAHAFTALWQASVRTCQALPSWAPIHAGGLAPPQPPGPFVGATRASARLPQLFFRLLAACVLAQGAVGRLPYGATTGGAGRRLSPSLPATPPVPHPEFLAHEKLADPRRGSARLRSTVN